MRVRKLKNKMDVPPMCFRSLHGLGVSAVGFQISGWFASSASQRLGDAGPPTRPLQYPAQHKVSVLA